MAIPTVQAVGTVNSGVADVTYALPTHVAGDILLLFIECNETVGVTAPSGGWAHITNSPRGQGANVTCINVMWLRAAAAGTTNPQVADPGNHQVGFAVVIRGAVSTGDPWDFTPVGDGGASATTLSADGGNTTGSDRLVLIGLAGNTDTLTDQWGSVANGNLSSFTEREQSWTDLGGGGGVACYTGGLASAGATGNTTATMPTQTWSSLTFALLPGDVAVTGLTTVAAVASVDAPTVSTTSDAAVSASTVVAVTSMAAPAVVGQDTSLTTNLVRNPSVEGTTSGYNWVDLGTNVSGGRGTGGGIARTGSAYFSSSLTLTDPDSATSIRTGSTTTIASSSCAPVTAGQAYTGSIYMKQTGGSSTHTAYLMWFTAASGFNGLSSGGTPVAGSGSYQRVSTDLGAVAPANTAYAVVVLAGNPGGGGTSGDTTVADDAMITEGSTLYAYFDGDTADGGGYSYAWTGTAHQSTSTRTLVTTPEVTVADAGTVTTDAQSTYTSSSFTPAQGDLLVVMCHAAGSLLSGGAAGTLTGSANGLTSTSDWDRVDTNITHDGTGTQYIFVANSLIGASPTSMTVTLDVTGDTGSSGGVAVARVSNMTLTGSSAVRQTTKLAEQLASTDLILTFASTTLTSNVVLGFVDNGANPSGLTPPTDFTEGGDVGYDA